MDFNTETKLSAADSNGTPLETANAGGSESILAPRTRSALKTALMLGLTTALAIGGVIAIQQVAAVANQVQNIFRNGINIPGVGN